MEYLAGSPASLAKQAFRSGVPPEPLLPESPEKAQAPTPSLSPSSLLRRTEGCGFQHIACLEEERERESQGRALSRFPLWESTPQKPPESAPVPYSIVLRVQPSASEGITDLLSASGCEHLITLEMLDPTEKSDTTLEPQD